jgi:hypothetical protein
MSLSKSEKIAQYSIMVIALVAVVVSVWQGMISQKQLEIQREYNRLTVKPYLNYSTGWMSQAYEWDIVLTNEGIGPAIIKSTEFTFNGVKYHDWDKVLVAAELSSLRKGSWNLGNDAPFAVGKSVNYLKLNMREKEKSGSLGISVVIAYESIYGEAYKLSFSF